MAWTTPALAEVCVGMEVTATRQRKATVAYHLFAALCRRGNRCTVWCRSRSKSKTGVDQRHVVGGSRRHKVRRAADKPYTCYHASSQVRTPR